MITILLAIHLAFGIAALLFEECRKHEVDWQSEVFALVTGPFALGFLIGELPLLPSGEEEV